MLKIGLTALVTAALCFTVAAATGFGATPARLFTMKVGDIASLPSDNFHCQAITTIEVACGAKVAPNTIQVYYAPHEIAVLKFNKTLKKATTLYSVDR
jgi:hypothetical protein